MITIPAATDIPLQMAVYELTPSEAQMEQFWKLYNSIDHVCTEDAALLDSLLDKILLNLETCEARLKNPQKRSNAPWEK